MIASEWMPRSRSSQVLMTAAALAALLIVLGLVLLITSANGKALFEFADVPPDKLAADEDVRGWITFDQPSYRVGDPMRYRIRLRWRDARVAPDLQTFETSISFFPLDRLDYVVQHRNLGGGVQEYLAEYALQAVSVDTPTTLRLDTATIYYTEALDSHTELQSLRVNPPSVHVGEYYPENIAGIALQPLKPEIDDARTLRRSSMIFCGITLLLMAIALLWYFGRWRTYAQLPPAEQLWRDFEKLRDLKKTDRRHVVNCEAIFTKALELQSGITPIEFWSGALVEGEAWHAKIAAARCFLSTAYNAAGPSAADVAGIVDIIDDTLAPAVETERLRRESENDPIMRLRQQPLALVVSAILVATAFAAFALAALPSAWMPADIRSYNAAVSQFDESEDLQKATIAFADIAEQSDDPRVLAASQYNLGTLLADRRMTRLSREQHKNFLRAIFLPDTSLTLLLHDLELDAEFELLTLLSELTRQYVRAEQAVQAAIRAGPYDQAMGRNLEILGKIRKAIGRTLAGLIAESEVNDDGEQLMGQTVIDLKILMQTELPDDYAKLDEGKDDRDYFILEGF